MTEHHPTLSPSSAPAIERCACYESGEAGKAADEGTRQHEILADALAGNPRPDDMPDGVEWAAGWIIADTLDRAITAPMGLHIEHRVRVLDDGFSEITFGTIDAAYGDTIADYKSGEFRDYSGQMKLYALGWMQKTGLDKCRAVILYGRYRRVDEAIYTLQECERYAADIKARRDDQDAEPTPCEYCAWCAKAVSCPAVNREVARVVEGYSAEPITEWHPSECNAEQLSIMMNVAKVAEAWTKSVKHHAQKLAMAGETIPGYRLVKRSGGVEIEDINAAYAKAGLPPEGFLGACSVSFPRLAKAISARDGVSDAKARKWLMEHLEGTMRQKADSVSLRADTKKTKEIEG